LVDVPRNVVVIKTHGKYYFQTAVIAFQIEEYWRDSKENECYQAEVT
jgi:hypothetical protein